MKEVFMLAHTSAFRATAGRLEQQLRARGVYAPQILINTLALYPDLDASTLIEEFDYQMSLAPRGAIGAAIRATQRKIARIWPRQITDLPL
jgi:hypothetical protein